MINIDNFRESPREENIITNHIEIAKTPEPTPIKNIVLTDNNVYL
jgi:hypothetical protein